MKIILVLLLLFSQSVFCQNLAPQSLNVGGASKQTTNYYISSSYGQNVSGTFLNSSYKISQGFQQTGISSRIENIPGYEIGEIPAFNVHSNIETAFYIKSDSLGKGAKKGISYEKSHLKGTIIFNPTISKFSIIPHKEDKGELKVIFKAKFNQDSVFQEVIFTFSPALKDEQIVFGLEAIKPLPDETDGDYIIISESKNKPEQFNNKGLITTSNFSIAGKTLIFDRTLSNKLQKFILNQLSIKDLNLYAETIIIRDFLHFPSANILIHAKTLRFEKRDSFPGISIEPEGFKSSAGLNIDGLKGINANSININVKYFQSDPGNLIMINGGRGQNATSGHGGNGGSGGNLYSTIDLDCYFDFQGGPGGQGSQGKNQGIRGENGKFILNNSKYSWLHPNYIKAVIDHTKSAYLNGYLNYCTNVYNEYITGIEEYMKSPEWLAVSDQEKRELDQISNEMKTLLLRIGDNLDYFGNPAGWVPMLSFEINKSAFENEVERAMNVLYLAYKIQKIDAKNDEKLAMIQMANSEQDKAYFECQGIYESSVAIIPDLIHQANTISDEIENIHSQINRLDMSLTERAKWIVEDRHRPPKTSWWKKAAKIVGTVAQVVPVFQPALGVIGGAVSAVANIDWKSPSSIFNTVTDQVKKFSGVDWGASTENFKSTVKSLDPRVLDLDKPSEIKDFYNKLKDKADPVIDTISNLKKNVGQVKVPLEEIQVELDRVRAESPEYQELVTKTTALMDEKAQFEQKTNIALQNVASSTTCIQNAIVAKEGLHIQAFELDSKKDLKALNYIREMERRAKDRLLKYHYFVSKAFEYRLVQPYTTDLETTNIFDRIRTIAEEDNDNILSDTEFSQLKGIYDDVISKVVIDIISFYNQNAPEKRAYISFKLDSSDLNLLNNSENVALNLVERNIIPINEENVRILDLRVREQNGIKVTSVSGGNSSVSSLDLNMEHSGFSNIKFDGNIYKFNHYSNSTKNPIIWKSRYDLLSNKLQNIAPSPSVVSLLKSVLSESTLFLPSDENLNIYSRPGAWADIIIRPTVTPFGTKIKLDSLILEVLYDFNQRSSNLVALNVLTNNELKPYIKLSRQDKNQRQDGYGTFIRTYFRNVNQTVDLEAPADYGSYKFTNWTDFNGVVLSSTNILKVHLNEDKPIRANYTLIQPILETDDTIRITKSSGTTDLSIKNIGNGVLEWRSIKDGTIDNNWFNFNSVTTGENNGKLSLSFTANNEVQNRIGKVVVIAPSSMNYIDTVTIIQSTSTTPIQSQEIVGLKIYPNPVKNVLSILFPTVPKFGNMAILTIQGQIVKEMPLKSHEIKLNIADLKSGIYMLMINYEGKIVTKKISKL